MPPEQSIWPLNGKLGADYIMFPVFTPWLCFAGRYDLSSCHQPVIWYRKVDTENPIHYTYNALIKCTTLGVCYDFTLIWAWITSCCFCVLFESFQCHFILVSDICCYLFDAFYMQMTVLSSAHKSFLLEIVILNLDFSSVLPDKLGYAIFSYLLGTLYMQITVFSSADKSF